MVARGAVWQWRISNLHSKESLTSMGALMSKVLRMVSCAAFLMVLSGCASSLMMEAPSQEIRPPARDKVKVVFMPYGPAADFMLGNLQGGKIYYSIVRPNWGTGGMIPTPVRADGTSEFHTKSPDFAGWVADTKFIVPNAEAKEWFTKEKPRYQEIYARYWATFQQKSADQKDERTLHPHDGL